MLSISLVKEYLTRENTCFYNILCLIRFTGYITIRFIIVLLVINIFLKKRTAKKISLKTIWVFYAESTDLDVTK